MTEQATLGQQGDCHACCNVSSYRERVLLNAAMYICTAVACHCHTALLFTQDKFYLLTKNGSIRLPNPPQMKNKKKNYVISLR